MKLHSSPLTGLVHISQLHPTKIESVSDVVELDMDVFVKIMEVTVEEYQDQNTGRDRTRHKLKLSMKYVDQEDGRDLDPESEKMEQDLFRSGVNKGKDNGGSRDEGTAGADSMLGRALASNIGMSTAIDPGHLILKGKNTGASASFNGYALVGEEEGESAQHNGTMDITALRETTAVRPMGRGRGTTLPAWMTRADAEDKLGTIDRSKDIQNKEDKSEDDSYQNRKIYKHSKREKRHKYHKRHKREHKYRRHRNRSRSPSYSSNFSRSRSGSHYRKRSKRSHRRDDRSRRRREGRSRSRSPSREGKRSRRPHENRSRSRSRSREWKNEEFANIEEAKAIMERLERRQRER